MFKVLCYNSNGSASWWKIYIDFYLIEYAYILLKIGPDVVLISVGGDDMYPVALSCEFLTWYIF